MKRRNAKISGYRSSLLLKKRSSVVFEQLEARRLLSVVSPIHPAAIGSAIGGFTPAQIVRAYGFDQINFSNGTVQGTGAGQTIAIVDAFNDPKIAADLAVFDQQFSLIAPSSLQIVNQSGGTKLPSMNSSWASETSLDVEWAHAIAPQAGILLVEANSANTSDLMAAVNDARHAAGVSVVSISWGDSEFESYGGGESQNQLAYDPIFSTPSGHTGETFVVSAGDNGTANGVQWPASSPNVVSVGGTTLTTSDSSGTYQSEAAWRGFQQGTSGGFSQFETEPVWQEVAQQSGARSTPDVGYDADPDTGFAIYDSVRDQGYAGWQEVGATSAGAPQWAALIAIADQGRAILGQGTLDGPTQTLPNLYSVYSPPGTTGYSTFTTYFHDIGNTGYGYSTGLGSPRAQEIVSLLGGGSSTTTPTPTPTPTPAPTDSPSSIAAVFPRNPPNSVVEGSRGSLKLRLRNTGSTLYSGPLTVTLYASTDGTVSSEDTQITVQTLSNINLNGLASKTVSLQFTYPDGITPGSYSLVAAVEAIAAAGSAPNDAVTASEVSIVPPAVDLATTFSADQPITVNPGQREKVAVTLTNNGNVAAGGTLGLGLYASADQTLDISDPLLASIANRKIGIRAGHSITLHIHFVAPVNEAGGAYNLIASATSNTHPADVNAQNDLAVIPTM